MILRDGWKRGLTAFFSAISACRRSRTLRAMAVPSILVAAMALVELENGLLEDAAGRRRCWRRRKRTLVLLVRVGLKTNGTPRRWDGVVGRRGAAEPSAAEQGRGNPAVAGELLLVLALLALLLPLLTSPDSHAAPAAVHGRGGAVWGPSPPPWWAHRRSLLVTRRVDKLRAQLGDLGFLDCDGLVVGGRREKDPTPRLSRSAGTLWTRRESVMLGIRQHRIAADAVTRS